MTEKAMPLFFLILSKILEKQWPTVSSVRGFSALTSQTAHWRNVVVPVMWPSMLFQNRRGLIKVLCVVTFLFVIIAWQLVQYTA